MSTATWFKVALSAWSAVLALCITGCGGAASQGSPVGSTPTSLNGNWLLAGQLPFLTAAQTGNKGFGLAMTFSVVGTQIVGGGTTQIPCSSSASIAGGGVVSGSVAQDGSFTAQTSSTLPTDAATLRIQGSVPSGSAGSWSGSYTFANNDPSCPFSGSGPVTAVRIADVTGTYSGSANLSAPIGTAGNPQPLTVSLTLQQGQPAASPAGTQFVNESALTGSIQVQGTSCFSTGQVVQQQPPIGGSVLGTNVIAMFTMDDGSHVSLIGNIEDTLSTKLGIVGVLIGGGKCDGQYAGPFELSRQ